MANYFQLSNGVRVAGNQPIDGDRYVVSNITNRDNLVTIGRAFNGLQVYVESEKVLYLLEDVSIPKWVTLQSQSGTTIISDTTQIIFNSGGTLSGNSNFTYNPETSVFSTKSSKSEFDITTSNYSDPTLYLKSNWVDGIKIDVAHNSQIGPIISTEKSKGTITSKTNVVDDFLVIYDHAGYFNETEITGADIKINAKEWSLNSYTTEYKISTVSSGNTNVDERFLINSDGNIRFNSAYTFPKESGTTNQILTLSANSYLYWSDSNNSSLSGLTDTIINNPQEGDKLIYSGNSWINVKDTDYILSQNISSGGTFEFILGQKDEENAFFVHFMNYRQSGVTEKIFQMGELQLLHDGNDATVTTNGQDLDLYVTYTARLENNDIILICNIPTELTSDVIMKYTIEKF